MGHVPNFADMTHFPFFIKIIRSVYAKHFFTVSFPAYFLYRANINMSVTISRRI